MRPRKQIPMIDVAPSYKGGHTAMQNGYVYELDPTHPTKNYWGYVPQHRLVAEDRIGRFLTSDEVVHHIDENPLNNHPDNLQVMPRKEHQRMHTIERNRARQAQITHEQVSEALQGRSLKDAAALLGVHTQTLRNRFPELTRPRQRRTPTSIDDPQAIATVLRLASDVQIGLRQVAERTGMSASTVKRICQRNGIEWVQKTRKGEKRRQYRRKSSIHAALIPDASQNAPVTL